MAWPQLWLFFLVGYAVSVLVELPILLLGLAGRHPLRVRLFAGFWLTACTYPTVVFILPPLFSPAESRVAYLAVAETFAPVAECLLFWATFGGQTRRRDFTAIALANLASFGVGEVLNHTGWWTAL